VVNVVLKKKGEGGGKTGTPVKYEMKRNEEFA
jgi:hypothetical protein